MKFTLIAAISALSTLAAGLVLPDQTPLTGGKIFPSYGITIREDYKDIAFPPAEVFRSNGMHNIKTLLCFKLPSNKKCTIRFSDADFTSGSRRMQLYTTGRCPDPGDSWDHKPFTDQHKGTFVTTPGGSGPASVVEDFGLTFTTSATKYGFEVQPAYDNVYITWDITRGGYYFTCD